MSIDPGKNGREAKRTSTLNVEKVREDFPVLSREVHPGKPLIYLDNAATSQKPRVVIDRMTEYYSRFNANVHRGIHVLSDEATDAYESSRRRIQQFINAESSRSVVFTRGTTESINLVASGWGRKFLQPGDEVVVSVMEHHSNLVPWHLIAEDTGIIIRGIEISDDGHLDLDHLESLLHEKTALVAVTQMSNVLGTINPIRKIADMAHAVGAKLLVDGAQGAAHMKTDVREMDCDFYAFSGHKMCGPTGVGVLYGKYDLLDSMHPFLGGGEMIEEVHLDSSTYKEPPWKFEAGTPNIAQAIGLGTAIEYLQDLGMDEIHAHESDLMNYAMQRMRCFEDLHVFGPLGNRGGMVSFTMEGTHPHDIATVVDQEGVAIRAGHHCAQPLMRRLGVGSTARISMYLYNTIEEIDKFFQALNKVREIFGNVAKRTV